MEQWALSGLPGLPGCRGCRGGRRTKAQQQPLQAAVVEIFPGQWPTAAGDACHVRRGEGRRAQMGRGEGQGGEVNRKVSVEGCL
jgi:hypothetical protein